MAYSSFGVVVAVEKHSLLLVALLAAQVAVRFPRMHSRVLTRTQLLHIIHLVFGDHEAPLKLKELLHESAVDIDLAALYHKKVVALLEAPAIFIHQIRTGSYSTATSTL